MHPVAGSQLSSVQGLASSQFLGPPGRHEPAPSHASPRVHALPSLQVIVLGGFKQPVTASQASSVHGLPSAHSITVRSSNWQPRY